MSHKLCVYTCITGDYDNLHEIKNPEKNIDYYCFTNNQNLKSKTWKIIQIKNNGLDNQHLSRKIKMLGHPIISDNYDVSLWMDASVVWDESITEFVKTYFKDTLFAAFTHNARTSVYDEAVACLRLRKDTKDQIVKTLDFFRTENFPDNLGLYEMTVFIKKHNDEKVIEAMEMWFNMVRHHSKRDQLSFPYVIWKTNLEVAPINLSVWHNSWFHTIKHNSINSTAGECHVYYGNPDQDFNFDKYHIYEYDISENTCHFDTVIPSDTEEIEFNPTNIVGVYHKNLDLKPKAKQTVFPNSVPCNDGLIFCTDHGVIRAYGDFKKGQKLSFSINMYSPSIPNLKQAVQGVWELRDLTIIEHSRTSHKYSKLIAENKELSNQLASISSQLQNVLNSKRWKLFQSIRKIFPPYR